MYKNLGLGDFWPDGERVTCYEYMRNKRIVVSGNWDTVLYQRDRELAKAGPTV